MPDESIRPPTGLNLVAYLAGEPIGSGALKGGAIPEIKRLWVSETARGLGVGRRLMDALEQAASEAGATRVRLDTNRALSEATAMYGKRGYVEVGRLQRRADVGLLAREAAGLAPAAAGQLLQVGHLALGELAHHLLHLAELLDQVRDGLDVGARALRDPLAP